ncbi:hypothetical protein J7376_19465 [Paracoccus sp. R12_1]|uniref:hypothetical protein n=1 Tax=unclassified Paracoccus (in: a-proteobacteria) TaxID=2688777 RepID=UPI001ADA0D41|nr:MULTISPECIES: hypothetical protein [unclassified Paracoccus (in: a-proteobacteria)]MBO9457408.1 hypothetical protein [Paracoccus sp. R12_2]MBO9488683.1 hypothetical protein [Paracoccus sp. R12_1]
MNIIEPVRITPAMLISSNVPEDDHPGWDAGTTYGNGDRVIRSHKIFESVQGGNTGHNPAADDIGEWWVEVSATNRWRAFDLGLADPATNADSIRYELTLGRTTDAIAVFGMNAASLRVTVTDPIDGVIHDATHALIETVSVHDAWSYCFGEISSSPDLILRDLPIWSGATLAIQISAPGGTASVGEILIGQDHPIGRTLVDTAIGLQDYSIKERDDFGGAVVVERGFTRTVDFRFVFPTEDARRIQSIMSRIRASVAVFYAGVGTDQFATSVPGFYRDFSVPLSTNYSFGSLEVESLL